MKNKLQKQISTEEKPSHNTLLISAQQKSDSHYIIIYTMTNELTKNYDTTSLKE